MPYPRARFWVAIVIAITLIGFWPTYFSVLGQGPWQFHAHGVAAGLWIVMVAAQGWTAQHRWFGVHGAIGKASLVLFPFLIGGLAAIIDLTGKSYVAGGDPVRTLLGGSFLIGLVIAVAAYLVLFHNALRHRRRTWLHAGYMLATPLILWESPFSRVLNMVVPALQIAGPQDFGRILPAILLADLSAFVFCLLVRWRVGARAQPFLIAAGFIAAQMFAMAFMGNLPPVLMVLTTIGRMPSAAVVGIGFFAGALASWSGWRAGGRKMQSARKVVQPA